MHWLLDTCALSELVRKKPDPGVLDWLSRHSAESAVSVISIGELQFGVERLPSGRTRNLLQHWFEGIGAQFSARILVADEAILRRYGSLRASVQAIGRSQEDLDLILAATASVHRLALVTRNIRHFQDTGIELVNPWS
ncbi:MAG TPA: type II toxin-antitoxin system VapC family toxin [Burkholderiaceae bacterium]